MTALVVAALLAQEAHPDRAPAPSRLNVRITETFKSDRAHSRFTQPRSVTLDTPAGPLTFDSRCEWVPQEDKITWPEDPEPVGPFTITTVGTWIDIDIKRPPHTFPPDPREDPVVTKAGLGGDDGDSGGFDPSDTAPLYGPDFDLELGPDLAGGLPEWLTVHLHARALFGELELYGASREVELYSVGVRLEAALLGEPPFTLGLYLSAGPGWLRTEIGEATGFDGGAGARANLHLTENVYLSAALEAHAFLSEDLRGWGPAVMVGCNLGW